MPDRRAAARRLPPPALGRPAPAGDDRHGARLRAEAPDRRRADDGARRHHPGPDPRPARRPAPATCTMAVILITHDMGVIAGRADRVLVMYAGQDRRGRDDRPSSSPRMRHPYSEALLASVPKLDQDPLGAPASASPGLPPDLSQPIAHCRFAARCRYAQRPTAARASPPLDAGRGQRAASHLARLLPPGRRRPADHRQPARGGGQGGRPERQGRRGRAGPPRRPAPRRSTHAPVLVRARPRRQGVPRHVGRRRPAQDRHGQGRLRRLLHDPPAARPSAWSASPAAARRRSAAWSSRSSTRRRARSASRARTSSGSTAAALRRRRRDLQMMFQDPYASLDPRMRVGSILREPLKVQGIGTAARAARHGCCEMLDEVGLPPTVGRPLPARVLRRPAPAHRPGPGPRARARS